MAYYITEINKNGQIAVDDTILVKDIPATAGSKMLEKFVPLFSAEAVEKLLAAGYTLSGKTAVGEFGLDLYGETSKNDICAAAKVVKEGSVKAALNVDLNGTPRRAAAIEGVTFVKPTYGTVSRYGIIAAACSGEQIGVTAKDAATAAEVLSVIAGHDPKDGTSLKEVTNIDYNSNASAKGMKLALVKELYDAADAAVKAKIDAAAAAYKAQGAEVEEISFANLPEIQTAWTILMSAETTNNLSRFDGVKYGHRTEKYKNIDELYVGSRTEAFGFLTKATILYGSDVLSKGRYEDCYDKSLKIRRKAAHALKELFVKYDALLTPAYGKAEFETYDVAEAFGKVYEASLFTAPASITGMPAVVTKGVQLVGDYFCDGKLLALAKALEKEEA